MPDAAMTAAEYAAQYMPRIAVPEHERWLDEDFAATAAMRARVPHRRDVRYGPGPLQTVDLFPAREPGSPVLVFIHGGYWRALSKDHVGFIAGPMVEAGAAVAMVEYDLCPAISLAAQVEQVAAALRFVRGAAREINGDPERLTISGNSAGAHLAAMMLARDWNADGGAGFIRGAVLVTGIYDLAPIPHIQVREDVHLTAGDIAALSPQLLAVKLPCPALVAAGADEPPLWIAESTRYHEKRRAAGLESELMIVPGHHHFSINRALAAPGHPLFQAALRMLQL
jgi:arylformamidase